MDLDITELDGGLIVVILEAEVSLLVSAAGLTLEEVDELVVEDDGDLISGCDDLKGVPFADFKAGMDGGLDIVDGTGFEFI